MGATALDQDMRVCGMNRMALSDSHDVMGFDPPGQPVRTWWESGRVGEDQQPDKVVISAQLAGETPTTDLWGDAYGACDGGL